MSVYILWPACELAKGYLSKFRGEISYSKPCLDIRESPKTQGINGRREYPFATAKLNALFFPNRKKKPNRLFGGDGGGNPAPVKCRRQQKGWSWRSSLRGGEAVGRRTGEEAVVSCFSFPPRPNDRISNKKAEFARIFSIRRHPSIYVEQRRPLLHGYGWKLAYRGLDTSGYADTSGYLLIRIPYVSDDFPIRN
jgi:hypothetical protein